MLDAIYVAVVLAFFAVSIGYVYFCAGALGAPQCRCSTSQFS
jgi:hypothetical protein